MRITMFGHDFFSILAMIPLLSVAGVFSGEALAADVTITQRLQKTDWYAADDVDWKMDLMDWVNDVYRYQGTLMKFRETTEETKFGESKGRSQTVELDQKELLKRKMVLKAFVQKLSDQEVLLGELAVAEGSPAQVLQRPYQILRGQTWQNFKDGQQILIVVKGMPTQGEKTEQKQGITIRHTMRAEPAGTARTCLLSKQQLVCNTPEVILAQEMTFPLSTGQKNPPKDAGRESSVSGALEKKFSPPSGGQPRIPFDTLEEIQKSAPAL